MKFSMSRALTIARREYLTTIKRKAFLFTVIAMPAYFAFVMTFSISLGSKEAKRALAETNTIALVDSTGLLAQAPPVLSVEISEDANPFDTSGKPPVTSKFSAEVRRYPAKRRRPKRSRRTKCSRCWCCRRATWRTARRGAIRRTPG